MSDNKTRFTFSFFDAAHTDGYIAPAKGSEKDLNRSDNQVASRGFFSDDEEDEDIVAKLHHWKQTNDTKPNQPQNRRELRDLFAEPVKKEDPHPESDNSVPTAGDDIQLNRLLDDYMLGEKGDRIMQQMEELAMDDKPLPERDTKSHPKDHSRDDKKSEPSLDLDAMLSMEDFEKYIAEN
ncbi:uncharacterized protein IUM83_00456 [Phytophthora cinnamomi]|uniref:uncharacterized protein n=1 Tax=Phytophthora cinnamomi TaxID=4785 RepID=UPI003559811D|nr:hypothetical protein IUM83_00456 [Phytophthora cinnamomi]